MVLNCKPHRLLFDVLGAADNQPQAFARDFQGGQDSQKKSNDIDYAGLWGQFQRLVGDPVAVPFPFDYTPGRVFLVAHDRAMTGFLDSRGCSCFCIRSRDFIQIM